CVACKLVRIFPNAGWQIVLLDDVGQLTNPFLPAFAFAESSVVWRVDFPSGQDACVHKRRENAKQVVQCLSFPKTAVLEMLSDETLGVELGIGLRASEQDLDLRRRLPYFADPFNRRRPQFGRTLGGLEVDEQYCCFENLPP